MVTTNKAIKKVAAKKPDSKKKAAAKKTKPKPGSIEAIRAAIEYAMKHPAYGPEPDGSDI